MRSVVILLVFLFVLADAGAFLVWWTHPQGAKKMGFSGELPVEIPVALPWMKKSKPSFLKRAPQGAAPQQASAAPAPARQTAQTQAQPARSPQPSASAVPGRPMGAMTPMSAVSDKPGGCADPQACSDYCLDVSHRNECQAYCVKKIHHAECLEWDRLAFSDDEPVVELADTAPAKKKQPRRRTRRSRPSRPKDAESGLLGDEAFSGL